MAKRPAPVAPLPARPFTIRRHGRVVAEVPVEGKPFIFDPHVRLEEHEDGTWVLQWMADPPQNNAPRANDHRNRQQRRRAARLNRRQGTA